MLAGTAILQLLDGMPGNSFCAALVFSCKYVLGRGTNKIQGTSSAISYKPASVASPSRGFLQLQYVALGGIFWSSIYL